MAEDLGVEPGEEVLSKINHKRHALAISNQITKKIKGGASTSTMLFDTGNDNMELQFSIILSLSLSPPTGVVAGHEQPPMCP
ncbi:hypothetical protein BVRB_2g040470 [Beta vulgaris subsp. vulgaris]|nr:hypothetical protein BVRB_2g040470 [Beta vulgaris subsp. vulgaris]